MPGAAPVATKRNILEEEQGGSERNESSSEPSRPPKWDVMAERTCRNGGCGRKYRELDNNDEACSHHPGTAVFHDRKRGVSAAVGPSIKGLVAGIGLGSALSGNAAWNPACQGSAYGEKTSKYFSHQSAVSLLQWKCCSVYVHDFDEFMAIPPCAKGWHSDEPR